MSAPSRFAVVANVALATLLLAACAGAPDTAPPGATTLAPWASATPSPDPSPTIASSPTPAATPAAAPAAAGAFFDAPSQADVQYAQLLAAGRTADAELIALIAEQPTATWLGEWINADAVTGTVASITSDAEAAGAIPVFVIYAIPGRDCGLYSAGGLPEDQYVAWVSAVAAGLEGRPAWFVLEPDALAQIGDCDGQGDRAGMLAAAAKVLDEAGGSVYLDAGNSNWRGVDDTVARINQVGTANLAGFATNTSNYNATAQERAWGDQVAAATGLQYVIDTSRNGNGSTGEWCNPRGRALGEAPRLVQEGALDAYLWVKAPGESDGTCNGGPAAGQWWMDVALELAGNA